MRKQCLRSSPYNWHSWCSWGVGQSRMSNLFVTSRLEQVIDGRLCHDRWLPQQSRIPHLPRFGSELSLVNPRLRLDHHLAPVRKRLPESNVPASEEVIPLSSDRADKWQGGVMWFGSSTKVLIDDRHHPSFRSSFGHLDCWPTEPSWMSFTWSLSKLACSIYEGLW